MNAEFGAKTKPMAADGGTPAAITGGVLRFVGFDPQPSFIGHLARQSKRVAKRIADELSAP